MKQSILFLVLWISQSIFAADQIVSIDPPASLIEPREPVQQFVTSDANSANTNSTAATLVNTATENTAQPQPSPATNSSPINTANQIPPSTEEANALLMPNDDEAQQQVAQVATPTPIQANANTNTAAALGLGAINQAQQTPDNPLAGGIDINRFAQCKQVIFNLCRSARDLKQFQTCLSKQQAPNCKQFIAFATKTDMYLRDNVDYIKHYDEGKLDLIHLTRFGANYPGVYYTVGINGDFTDLIFGQQNQALDIRKEVHYPQIAARYPKVQLFSIVDKLPEAQARKDAPGLRLILRFLLLNGCHACERAGYADVAYDFSDSGVLQATTIFSMVPEQ